MRRRTALITLSLALTFALRVARSSLLQRRYINCNVVLLALGHVPPSFGNDVHSAAVVSLITKVRKLPKKNM